MAKRRRSYKTRYRTRTRTVYRKARSGGGSLKPIIDGLMAGAGATLLKKYLNVPFADDLAVLGVGYFRNNTTLKTIGGMGLAGDLLGGIGMNGNAGGYVV